MKVLYMGDDTISAAASYLAGVMTHAEIQFVHCPSGNDPTSLISEFRYDLFILSDFASVDLGIENARIIHNAVTRGSGLLMIGGWESFHGSGGDYDSSVIADILPVIVSDGDDRVNWYGPCIVQKVADHPALTELSFDPAPVVGGFNRIREKSDANVLLTVSRYLVQATSTMRRDQADVVVSDTAPRHHTFELLETSPLLVVGEFGSGRVGAFASDAAPHWVGGFVDWGEERVCVATSEFEIEVGDRYVAFFTGLLRWIGGATSS
jgi:uncharacterized membrane protein